LSRLVGRVDEADKRWIEQLLLRIPERRREARCRAFEAAVATDDGQQITRRYGKWTVLDPGRRALFTVRCGLALLEKLAAGW
jgi:hypothetical protein